MWTNDWNIDLNFNKSQIRHLCTNRRAILRNAETKIAITETEITLINVKSIVWFIYSKKMEIRRSALF